jgi:hypothetical protein
MYSRLYSNPIHVIPPSCHDSALSVVLLATFIFSCSSSLCVAAGSVVDLDPFEADPDADLDSTYHPDANPDADILFEADPTSHPDADPNSDPEPSFQIKAQTLEKVLK